MKIIIFTADEYNGGIQQFTFQLVDSLKLIGIDVMLFIPNEERIILPPRFESITVNYEKVKTINNNDFRIIRIVDQIIEQSPEFVIFTEDSMCSMQTMCKLPSEIKKSFVIHDVKLHSGFFKLRAYLVSLLGLFLRNKTLNSTDYIILLSKNSIDNFKEKYPKFKRKIIFLPLGAHVPQDKQFIPNELLKSDIIDGSYFLFFGRLDKYKGIYRLLEAYSKIEMPDHELPHLVVAGNGKLSYHEHSQIKENPNVLLIKRYLENGEMLWLIEHAVAVILPYTEASQSGVLPLAYHFGTPVIASNIPGLSEYVEDTKTGYLFNSISELSTKMKNILESESKSYMNENIKRFNERLNWENNLIKMLELLDN